MCCRVQTNTDTDTRHRHTDTNKDTLRVRTSSDRLKMSTMSTFAASSGSCCDRSSIDPYLKMLVWVWEGGGVWVKKKKVKSKR